MIKPVKSNRTGSRTDSTRRSFLRPFSYTNQILCTICTFFAKSIWILHFLCYRCGLSLSDVKWRAESNATTSGSWIGLVVEIISKTCLFSKNSVFSTSKTNFLGPSATSGGIWFRDDLSHTLLQVLRKLHGYRSSSLVAVAFPEVEKRPKMTSILTKIPIFFNIYVYKSMFEIFFATWRICSRRTFLCSFTSAIVSKLNFSTFFTRFVFRLKKWPKKRICTEMIARLTTVKSKLMQIVWIDQIRILRHKTYLWLVSYWEKVSERTKSCRFIFYRYKLHWFCYSTLVAMKPSKRPLFRKNLGISPKQRLI